MYEGKRKGGSRLMTLLLKEKTKVTGFKEKADTHT